jgi:hypothetical protein
VSGERQDHEPAHYGSTIKVVDEVNQLDVPELSR